jgi:hypothetical protein
MVAAASLAWQIKAGGLPPMAFDLISPLSREACVSRLRSKTDPAWSGAVVGSIGETSFRLRKRIYYRNSFQYSLSGKLIDHNGQTRLRCRIGLHPLVRAFLVVWFGGVLIGCGAITARLAGVLARGASPVNRWPGAAVPFLMLVGGLALVMSGRYLARDEPDFLIDFLRKNLETRDC